MHMHYPAIGLQCRHMAPLLQLHVLNYETHCYGYGGDYYETHCYGYGGDCSLHHQLYHSTDGHTELKTVSRLLKVNLKKRKITSNN